MLAFGLRWLQVILLLLLLLLLPVVAVVVVVVVVVGAVVVGAAGAACLEGGLWDLWYEILWNSLVLFLVVNCCFFGILLLVCSCWWFDTIACSVFSVLFMIMFVVLFCLWPLWYCFLLLHYTWFLTWFCFWLFFVVRFWLPVICCQICLFKREQTISGKSIVKHEMDISRNEVIIGEPSRE